MTQPIILASGSQIRRQLLMQARLEFEVMPARIDEQAIKDALLAEAAKPRDIADTLAEFKARKVSDKQPDALVIGCDQVLNFQGQILSKPKTMDDAKYQLETLRGQTHELISAAVICEDGKPIWRKVDVVRLTMRAFSDEYLEDYVNRNWPGIGDSVGGYKLEEEGVRLFAAIRGDYFTVLGLPLLDVLNYLTLRGELMT